MVSISEKLFQAALLAQVESLPPSVNYSVQYGLFRVYQTVSIAWLQQGLPKLILQFYIPGLPSLAYFQLLLQRSSISAILLTPSLTPLLTGTDICYAYDQTSLSLSHLLWCPWDTLTDPGNPPMPKSAPWVIQDNLRVTQDNPMMTQDDPRVTPDDPRTTQDDTRLTPG